MKVLSTVGDNFIFDPKEVFAACIAEHGEYLKEYMYMDSADGYTHHFKHPISRKYITVCL